MNSHFSTRPTEAGHIFEGGLANSGRNLNETVVAATVGSSIVSLDLSDGNHFTATMVQNAVLQFTGGNTGYQQLVTLRMLTSGTSSYNLTAGTNVTLTDTFVSGTTSGVYRTLYFLYDGSLGTPQLVEIGRSPLSLDSLAMTGNPSISGATNSLKLKGRDNTSFVHLYSDPSGRFNIFTDQAAAILFYLDNTKAMFNRYPELASSLDEPYAVGCYSECRLRQDRNTGIVFVHSG
jgi:hypothetical protein